MALDVKRAFLHGVMKRNVFIKLPAEDPRAGEPGLIAKLVKSMYGTRDAPQIWQGEVKKAMAAMEFTACVSTPCVYKHRTRDLVVVTHVDDFLCCGAQEDLQWFHTSLAQKYEIIGSMLGPEDDVSSRAGGRGGLEVTPKITFLGRTIEWSRGGLIYEANSKFAEGLLEEWDLLESRPVISPGSAEDTKEDEPAALDKQQAAKYRRGAAVLNYLALDRPDIAFSAKEVSRRMACPDSWDERRLKRILRYLKGVPRVQWHYRWQDVKDVWTCYVDSDWATCVRTRRSTSGGVLMRGSHLLLHWSRTQQTVALSSGEAELNAALKGGSEALGFQDMCDELEDDVIIHMYGDSTASRGILHREGKGRIKHLHVRQLWLQEKAQTFF